MEGRESHHFPSPRSRKRCHCHFQCSCCLEWYSLFNHETLTCEGGGSAAPSAGPSSAGGLTVPGFASSAVFDQLNRTLQATPAAERKATVSKVKGVFSFEVSNKDKKQVWFVDFKVPLRVDGLNWE